MVIKSKDVLRWVLKHQHKLKQQIRNCHSLQYKEKPKIFDNDYSFRCSDLSVRLAAPSQLRHKPEASDLQFGKIFTDHMLKVYYHKALGGWQTPEVMPFENIALHPAAKVLHYAVELFEGMKAYRGVDGRVRVFRPQLNMDRMNLSAERSGLPTFDGNELVQCINKLISIDQEWVPHSEASSLYIRPTLIGIDGTLGVSSSESALLYTILCPVGSYFAGTDTTMKGVSLLADPSYTRAWPGGCGDRKMGSNYGPTIRVQSEAIRRGRQQVLWLYGDDHQLTEVGTMNIFMFYINDNGEREMVTPPLNGLILPGITRHSIIQMSEEWNEFKVNQRVITMSEVVELLNSNRLLEMFGSGTACVVSPISYIEYANQLLYIPTTDHKASVFQRIMKQLTDIQYGHIEHPWAEPVD